MNTKILHDSDIREPLFDYLEERLGKIRVLEEKQNGRARADVVIGNYYIISGECSAKDLFNNKDRFEIRMDFEYDGNDADLVYLVIDNNALYGKESIPEIQRESVPSNIESSSEGIVLIDGQLGEYGVEDEWGIVYYLPAGTYSATAYNRGGLYVCDPLNDETSKSYEFSAAGDSNTITVPEGYYIQLVINTSVELVKLS